MPRRLSEDATRKQIIDPQLGKAGWYLRDHSQVKTEIRVDGYEAEPWNGVSDHTLYRENGEVLAVVEAKETVIDVHLAEAQLTHYVTEIERHESLRPFGFLGLFEQQFGATAVERRFTEKEVQKVVEFANRMAGT